MATFQAEAEHAPVVAAMLFEFNSEFDSPVPSITDLMRRFTALSEDVKQSETRPITRSV